MCTTLSVNNGIHAQTHELCCYRWLLYGLLCPDNFCNLTFLVNDVSSTVAMTARDDGERLPRAPSAELVSRCGTSLQRHHRGTYWYVAHWLTPLLLVEIPKLWFWVASLSRCPMADPGRYRQPPPSLCSSFLCCAIPELDGVQPLPRRGQLPSPHPLRQHAACRLQPATCNLTYTSKPPLVTCQLLHRLISTQWMYTSSHYRV
jgi:hypothetical protein